MNSNSQQEKYKLGLTLSGGGARGIAHIGVLEALEKYGIVPGIISGTSMGALVGVFYAAGYSPKEILNLITSSSLYEVVNWHVPFSGLVNIKGVVKILQKHVGQDDFSALKKPFYCAVSNLNSGKLEIKSKGELFKWVMASISVPVILKPQIIDGNTYVDGGLLNNLPTAPIRDKCEFLIGVNVNYNEHEEKVEGMQSVAERCFRLAIAKNIMGGIEDTDFMIQPPEVSTFSTFAFNKAEEIYKIGFECAEKRILEEWDSNKLGILSDRNSKQG